MSKGSKLKEKVDGDTLDLSLDSLTTVPVKDIATLKKIKALDLSCNNIITLPDDFCTLTHLVRLDLSKNGLEQLPVSFGQLTELQHLDLLGNKLNTLPISMHQMTRLRWLDLKDNCFEESWKTVTGDCLNEQQCKKCARDVIAYLTSVKVREDARREEQLKRMKEIEARQLEEDAVAREARRAEKAAEKERRRAAYHERQQQLQHSSGDSAVQEREGNEDEALVSGSGAVLDCEEPARGWGCCTKLVCWVLPILGTLLATVILVFILHDWCVRQPEEPLCRNTNHVIEPLYQQLLRLYRKVKMPNRVFAN